MSTTTKPYRIEERRRRFDGQYVVAGFTEYSDRAEALSDFAFEVRSANAGQPFSTFSPWWPELTGRPAPYRLVLLGPDRTVLPRAGTVLTGAVTEIVAEAIRALEAFGVPLTARDASELLPTWARYRDMSVDDITAVLDHYKDGAK